MDNKNYQTAINKDNCDLKNAEQLLLKIATENINENEARKLYENLIEPKVDKLTSAKGKGKDKRNNVLDILNNIKLGIFEGCYYHYFDKPKITEESIAERTKLRRQRLNMVKEKEKNINNKLFSHYFNYSSPSNMLSRLSDAKGEISKDQVYLIEKTLTKIKNIVRNVPKDNPLKTEENEKVIDIVERILELNSQNQLGLGLKFLTPNQMLSRLSISLAELKAGKNSEKLKNEIRQFLYRSKKLTKQLYKSLVDII